MPILISQLSHTYLPGSALAYPALSNIDLTVQDGEFLGVIGHTGSGKSTMIQHLNGLLLPTSGTVTVDGLDTQEKKLRKKIRSLVGMVFQYPEYQLFEETVEKDVSFGPKNMGL
ncbi:MAG: ATP-binding cassette domain-containing protein, partial [Clostridia bacterium]|nr:ATP-binding cassette domain-containing protein [Clostridia bacterium]